MIPEKIWKIPYHFTGNLKLRILRNMTVTEPGEGFGGSNSTQTEKCIESLHSRRNFEEFFCSLIQLPLPPPHFCVSHKSHPFIWQVTYKNNLWHNLVKPTVLSVAKFLEKCNFGKSLGSFLFLFYSKSIFYMLSNE